MRLCRLCHFCSYAAADVTFNRLPSKSDPKSGAIVVTPNGDADPRSVVGPQVGHVQRLGSLPVSLLQLPPPPPGPLRSGPAGAPPAAVALALAERSWLLRHSRGGWPCARALCSPRVLRAVALTLPASDEGCSPRHDRLPPAPRMGGRGCSHTEVRMAERKPGEHKLVHTHSVSTTHQS